MKLIVQIPCFNEATTLPAVLASIPKSIEGVSSIQTLIIDDGSTDGTSEVARSLGVTHLVRNVGNLGLAFSFRRGLDTCLANGADIIVNMDGDNQYKGSEIPQLIAPILNGRADMVVGDRQTDSIAEFSSFKKLLQRIGSGVIRRLSKTRVIDATSGFRAFSKNAALKLTILSNYTYTHEAILQAPSKGLIICDVPVSVNAKTRDSRLMRNIRDYIVFSVASIIRIFTMYNPLKVFVCAGLGCLLIGTGIVMRFIYYYLSSPGVGKIQSLIFAAVFILGGITIILVGFLADLIQFNRRLLEDVLERIKKIEFDRR